MSRVAGLGKARNRNLNDCTGKRLGLELVSNADECGSVKDRHVMVNIEGRIWLRSIWKRRVGAMEECMAEEYQTEGAWGSVRGTGSALWR